MKYCINCKHMSDAQMCRRPRALFEHPVFGMIERAPRACIEERGIEKYCGTGAAYFEEKQS